MTLWNESRPLALEDLRRQRAAILEVARGHGVRDIRVFGSVARGEADADSDVEFLVELEWGRSLFDLGGLLMDLQELLGGSVDVVTPAGLGERVRAQVLRDAVPI
jgi:predicted nucleotidyltransferase